MIGHLVTGSKRIARAIRFRIELYKWVVIVTWRTLRGRWYVFRDAPDWFVEICAEAEAVEVEPAQPESETIGELLRQAAAEWRLRLMRRGGL